MTAHPPRRRHPEDDLQRAVMRMLDTILIPPAMAFHVPNGGRRDAREAARFKAMGVKPGVSDIIIVWPNDMGFVELKAPKGRHSPAQLEFLNRMIRCGHHVATCWSVDEVMETLRHWRVPMRCE